jgi:ureidoglycolate hydrolase
MKTVRIERATAGNVKPFGTLVVRPRAKATSKTGMLTYWKQRARFSLAGGKGEVGFLIARPHRGVYRVLETHLKTPEILIALNCDINMPVAPAARRKRDKPDVTKVRAFRVARGSAIVLNRGVWHYLPQPVGRRPAEILVVFADNTSANDCTVCDLGTNAFNIGP